MLDTWRKKYWERFCEKNGKQEFPSAVELPFVFEKQASTLVFCNGFFMPECSSVPDGIVCLPLDEAMRIYGVFLQNRISRTIKEETDALALLNGAQHGRGVFIYAPPEIALSLRIEHVSMSEDLQMPRMICYLGKGARCEIVQRFSTGKCNAYLDAILEPCAEMSLHSVEGAGSRFSQAIRASLKRESKFTARLYSEGSKLSNTSIKVQLQEEQSEALLQGLSKLSEQRQHKIDVLVSHLAPYTRSRQHFKALVQDQAHASFEGKIYVHPSAQKTEAYQLSNNLLLGDRAVAHAKPNLEIFADDVKATHGATFKQMDAEELFYLRSRGIPKEEAQMCLVESFCGELRECIP